MNAGDVALACMRVFVDELHRQGVDAVCISPGSRSTALTLAFARDGRFAVHVHLDERASAFFALGRAKATGRPCAVVCTSGTATANYLPAVVEASLARVPLIVLTADRPPALRGTGANQTIDQRNLYGIYARSFVEGPVPTAAAGAARAWRTIAARAVAAAMGSPAGAAHVDLPFDEPLTPTGDEVEMRDGGEPSIAKPATARAKLSDVNWLARLIEDHEHGAILAGWLPEPAHAICDLAVAAGWPLLAEPTSNLRLPYRALSAPQVLLGNESFARVNTPEVVVQFGGAPTTRAALAFAASAQRLITVDPDGWAADPARKAERIVHADPDGLAVSLTERLKPRETSWLDRWLEADAVGRRALDDFLDSTEEPFEPRIARDLVAALPDGSTLLIGNSTPVRDLDLAMAPREGVRVMANRGASGIDGLVSTTLGIASTGAPTTALIGDLTLLHDIGSLLWTGAGDTTFVVIDNGGGAIFDLLPSAALPENDALFVTPPRRGATWGALTKDVRRLRVDRKRQLVLRAALKQRLAEALAK